MRCRYEETRFRNENDGYCVLCYSTEDPEVPEGARNKYRGEDRFIFTAVGTELPAKKDQEVELNGRWVKSKYGLQLSVESFTEIRPQTEEGIRSYLSSGMIRGIGPKMAEQIVGRFGIRTFEILDYYPDSLLEIKGITPKKLEGILTSYQGEHMLRDLAAFLSPFQITPKKIRKIYETFGNEALEIVQNQPFSLCQISGFGFLTVDEIARKTGCSPKDPMRIEGCIEYCMEQENQEGHLFQVKLLFQEKVYEKLNYGYEKGTVTELEIAQSVYKMVEAGKLHFESGVLYAEKYYRYEHEAAKALAALLMQKEKEPEQLEEFLSKAQEELGICLAAKQKEAVKNAFSFLFTIITGGPGTGKTTVEKVILYIHEKLRGGSVLLMAPTGRASRRMAECTGCTDASTMHSALGLVSEEMESESCDFLEADLILVDEMSMVDMRLAYEFFTRIKRGTRVVLIGDVNQLSSVGPGNVFRELIQCGAVPVTVLDQIFRQGKGSLIAANAYKMLNNSAALEYGEDFVFLPADNAECAAEIVEREYRRMTAELGIDQVQVLTPYRKSGAVSVNALNERLWNLVNPKMPGKAEMKVRGRIFREKDKVIHNKNKNEISNGDTGFITGIYLDEDNLEVSRIEFPDNRCVEYSSEDMEMIEHAYATTVHKSQGSEYSVVILPWMPMFYKMLRRNILYTAITRAKVKLILVGSKQAVYRAVHNTESDKRNTRLGEMILKERYALESREKIVPLPDADRTKYEQIAMNF